MTELKNDRVVIGKITMPYGVKGWVKIVSYTDPVDNILQYRPWEIVRNRKQLMLDLADIRPHGKHLVAQFEQISDRDAAELIRGAEIMIARDKLPQPPEGEYYRVDLEGLEVINIEGVKLGKVDHVMETGANDVLVVQGEREHLIPFVQQQFIKSVDLEQGIINVDWDPDF